MDKLILMDTTFRDGQQSPLLFDTSKYSFSLEDRKLLIKGLIELGVTHFEFFSPIVGKNEEQIFKKIKKYVNQNLKKEVIFIAHCRCNQTDINLAIKAGFNGLNLYMGTSEQSIKYNHGKSIDEVVDLSQNIIKKYRKLYPNLYLRFSGEDAFRTSLSSLTKVYDKVYKYVDTLGMPDTVGIATPLEVTKVVKFFKKRYPKVNLETHFHNDRGFALINTLTAIKHGARVIDTSIWGMAERSGISSTTGVLLNTYLFNKSLILDYKLQNCYPLNVLMASILNTQVPYNEPVSLTNRTHIAGVHTGAVLKNSKVYEGINLADFGVNKKHLLIGPLSGWNIISYYIREVLYYSVNDETAKKITLLFKKQTSRVNKYNKPEDILESICMSLNLPHNVPYIKGKNRIENLD